MASFSPQKPDLDLPRILCLHGGGTNADIFRAQTRQFIRLLPDFRLVFADAPFFCNAGPGVVPVYEGLGPFRRWLRWLPEHPPIDDNAALGELQYSIQRAKDEDAGRGPWVGLLGFSQGAKIAASLLYDQQIHLERDRHADTNYVFAVLLAGRGPLVSFCEHSQSASCATAGSMADEIPFPGENTHVSRLPTIHVHGLNDNGLPLHQKLRLKWHDPTTTTLFEWDGDHRVPFKMQDVQPIVNEMYRIARIHGVKLGQKRVV